ncbi:MULTISPECIES: hypothetical protein [Actinokineospora]|uniref:Uncharacterized protein n=1 Tax=Actinokineospora fastidiosa TaxID=1816 RepID=A0A918LHF8_9PSEU|nr:MULTISPECIES: hypothetical protein [Actinokineospora]UVS78091.1 hypothetical protein Actkin_01815 [Actinokineospora sp. UTMC 2448]GGS49775.1 hypothetical protein GCM10010171_51130 [Actinokineospora fastidiosa]
MKIISRLLLALAMVLPLSGVASAETDQDQTVELILQGNTAFAYLFRSYLNDSDWTDISTDGGATWNGPLGKVVNTWGGATGMTSEDVHVPTGQWVRACAWYAGGPHCTHWRQA